MKTMYSDEHWTDIGCAIDMPHNHIIKKCWLPFEILYNSTVFLCHFRCIDLFLFYIGIEYLVASTCRYRVTNSMDISRMYRP